MNQMDVHPNGIQMASKWHPEPWDRHLACQTEQLRYLTGKMPILRLYAQLPL